jgi:hypothetical protein
VSPVATLEMVPLRSVMPPMGLVTLRYPTIRLNAPIPATPQVREAEAVVKAPSDSGNQGEEGREAR